MSVWTKVILAGLVLLSLGGVLYRMSPTKEEPWLAVAEKRNFDIDIRAVGVLEAENSLVICSSIKGDLGKIIDVVPDGKSVNQGEVLVRLDSTPFENKLAEVDAKIREQEVVIASLENAVAAEEDKALLEERTAKYEMRNAQIERDKTIHGDGPMEMAKLGSALDKAKTHYLELQAYEADLDRLEKKGYLNSGEKRQALKKLEEAREAFESAKLQYESYVNHVYPLQVKKAELGLKKAQLKFHDAIRSAAYKVTKAQETLQQHKLGMDYLENQRQEVLRELALTEIKAPTCGLAVLREEYRSGERRRPRVGDVVLKNQPLLNLPDMSSVIVKTKVREVDLHKIAVGKSARIAVDAYPDLSFKGEVVAIGVLAVAGAHHSDDKIFDVTIRLSDTDERLRPGMTARVTIHSSSVQDQLAIPLHAVFSKEGSFQCYKRSLRAYQPIPIALGRHNEDWVEVLDGLNEGDWVALIDPEQMP